MDSNEFVDVLRAIVDGVTRSELSVLRSPPGRSPWPVSVERSNWFNSLEAADQEMVASILRVGASAALFDVCCLLDGVAGRLDDRGGALRLLYVSDDGHEVLLNNIEILELHDEFRGEGPPP